MPAPRPGPAPAVTSLVRSGVEFTLHPYDAAGLDEGDDLAELIDVEAERVLEAVVVEIAGRPAICIVRAGAELDESAVGAALGGTARVAVEALAERATGQPVEATSPFGLRRRLPAIVDADVVALGGAVTVVVPSGQAGMAVEVALGDLLRLTGAATAAITLPSPI